MDKTMIFDTGGTFNKVWNPQTESHHFPYSHLNEILSQGCNRGEYTLEVLMLKDSLDITDEEREFIANRCYEVPESRILMIHGTGTMIKTGELIAKKEEKYDAGKTIVLTGSWTPYSHRNSDAVFNFGMGYAAAQVLDSGVYIAMNGRILDIKRAAKNPEICEFYQILQ